MAQFRLSILPLNLETGRFLTGEGNYQQEKETSQHTPSNLQQNTTSLLTQ